MFFTNLGRFTVRRRRTQSQRMVARQGVQAHMLACQAHRLGPESVHAAHALSFSEAGRARQWSTAKRISSKLSRPYQNTFHFGPLMQPSDSSK